MNALIGVRSPLLSILFPSLMTSCDWLLFAGTFSMFNPCELFGVKYDESKKDVYPKKEESNQTRNTSKQRAHTRTHEQKIKKNNNKKCHALKTKTKTKKLVMAEVVQNSGVDPKVVVSEMVNSLDVPTSWWSAVSRISEITPTRLTDLPSRAEAPAPRTVPIVEPKHRSVHWGHWLQLSTGLGATAGLLYALYRKASVHYAHVTVIEMLNLPPETTGDFVEVCMPLSGEIRIDCSTLAHCKYQLKMNSSIKAQHGRVREESSRRPSRSFITLNNINKSELCDSWLSDYTGNLHFSTPCVTSEAMLMTYESTSHESLQPAVSIQDCFVEPASSNSHHRLTFKLHVYSSAMDVAVSMTLPKGSRILKVSTGGKGSVSAPDMYAPNELTWNVGTFTREVDGQSPGRTNRKTVLRSEGLTNAEGRAAYDSIPDGTLRESSKRSIPSSIQDEADLSKTIGASGTFNGVSAVELFAQEQMLAMTERSSQVVNFELVYVIDVREAERELNQRRTSAQATEAMVKNRRERRQEARDKKKKARQDARSKFKTNTAVEELESEEEDNFIDREVLDESHISFNPSEHTPGVHLSYSTEATASGLTVRKLLTSAEERNYNLFEDLLGPACDPSTKNASKVSCYTRKQRAARAIINGAASAFFTTRRKLRFGYRLAHSVLTRTPLQLSQEEIAEAEAAARVSNDISSRYAGSSSGENVRVPQSIVKSLRAADAQKMPSSPFGSNPFSENSGVHQAGGEGEDDGFVRVERPTAAQAGPRVAFVDSVVPPAPTELVPQPPIETFADKLIRERGEKVPKLEKKVRYITRFSQLVRVSAQF